MADRREAARIFEDRADAGRALAAALAGYGGRTDLLVLGLPRGGVPVAHEVARALGAPLDVLVVRKLGVPGHEELAMGAVASGGIVVRNEDVIAGMRIPESAVDAVSAEQAAEVARRDRAYRDDRPPPEIAGRTVFLIDDGLATGATMRAAAQAVRTQEPRRLIVAVPTAPPDTLFRLRADADDVVAVETPDPFVAVGYWYRHFPQVTDDEVRQLLLDGASAPSPAAAA